MSDDQTRIAQERAAARRDAIDRSAMRAASEELAREMRMLVVMPRKLYDDIADRVYAEHGRERGEVAGKVFDRWRTEFMIRALEQAVSEPMPAPPPKKAKARAKAG